MELSFISGGMYSKVYKTTKSKSNGSYAIKKITVNRSNVKEIYDAIKSIKALNSEIIISFDDIWLEKLTSYNDAPANDFQLYIQFEFIAMNLKDFIQNIFNEMKIYPNEPLGPVGYFIASELIKELIEGIDFLHKNHIVHGDLEPENIFVTEGNNGKLLKIGGDIGLSILKDVYANNMPLLRKYKAAEMSISNLPLTSKADIYSLGVIMEDILNLDINQ